MSRSLRAAERQIYALHKSSGYLTLRSHRRKQLKHHAGLVVAALRQAEARLDSDGDAALTTLAAALLKVAERAAVGRIGALLDDEVSPELTPARDWEPFRLAVAAVLIAACAVALAFLHVPDAAQAYAVGACGVLVLTLIYGRRVQQFLDLLGSLGGK
ncbi:hypothetical protein [Streptomyces siamensis]|uniref:hypothetical protein n=1 Tax=Streptomyces siamensis TaxID=1274986 RepID=UPI0031F08542